MKIAFLWHVTNDGDLERWRDGLWSALEIIKKDHEVKLFRNLGAPDLVAQIKRYNPDVLLCWDGFSAPFWENTLPYIDKPKVLCFAGGDPNHPNRDLFDKRAIRS